MAVILQVVFWVAILLLVGLPPYLASFLRRAFCHHFECNDEGPGEGKAFGECGERIDCNVGKVCGDVFGGVAMTNF